MALVIGSVLDVHDAGDYFMEVGKRGGQRPLQTGMV